MGSKNTIPDQSRAAIETVTSAAHAGRPRAVGALLLAVPLGMGLALSFFPSYDARSSYFVQSYSRIVDAGDRYLVALILFGVLAAIIAILALALSRSPLRTETSVLWAVIAGLAVAALGFGVAAGAGLPVWLWARAVGSGSEPMLQMAARSEALAATSQTMLLMFGLGGLLISMSALGALAALRRWVPRWLFLGTAGAAVALVVVGAAASGPVVWLAQGTLPMLWALTFGIVLLIRGTFGHPLGRA